MQLKKLLVYSPVNYFIIRNIITVIHHLYCVVKRPFVLLIQVLKSDKKYTKHSRTFILY